MVKDDWIGRISMPNAAELKINGKSLELPIVVGTEGEKAIDIRQLRAQTGYVTLDQGLHEHGRGDQQHRLHRRRRGDSALPGHSHRGAGREVHLRRGRLPPHLRQAAHGRGARPLFVTADPEFGALHEDMRHFFDRYPQARPTRWRSSRPWSARCRASTPRRSR
jgi:citrate synthase